MLGVANNCEITGEKSFSVHLYIYMANIKLFLVESNFIIVNHDEEKKIFIYKITSNAFKI